MKKLFSFFKRLRTEADHLDDRSYQQKINDHNLWGFVILTAIFCGGYVIAVPLAGKMVDFWFLKTQAGILAYSLTFPCTDIVGEVYGHRYAKKLVWAGLISVLVAAIVTYIALWWPASEGFLHNEAFNTIFKFSSRITIGSLITYWIAQHTDVFVFNLMKHLSKGKYLFLRNNVSTIISQGVDSLIFVLFCFYGTMSLGNLFSIILGTWGIKIMIALVDTPLVYLGVKLIQKHSPQLKK